LDYPIVTLKQEERDQEWKPLAEYLLQGGDIMSPDAPMVPNYDEAEWNAIAARHISEQGPQNSQ
jgi:hypothetical protein